MENSVNREFRGVKRNHEKADQKANPFIFKGLSFQLFITVRTNGIYESSG
jgi:hypothetical protein